MLQRLFTSKVRVDLIAHFVLHPEGQYHVRGLEKVLDAQYSAIWRELKNLEQAGFVVSEVEAGRRLFRLNPDYTLADELRGMILKTVGAGDQVSMALDGVAGIRAAFIYGSFANGQIDAYSDIDLMIIGELDLEEVSAALSAQESRLNRTINMMSFSSEEWEARMIRDDPFVADVIERPKLMLVGSEDDL